ncbi:hypothetical protein [Kitasatospora phosalacinea]|uniref:AAA+ ATPase domain-containing protein n=1 Tax=Kitasatospora phosalacinea TaxID=2065 RepID=A0ABW6GLX5_9ACTN
MIQRLRRLAARLRRAGRTFAQPAAQQVSNTIVYGDLTQISDVGGDLNLLLGKGPLVTALTSSMDPAEALNALTETVERFIRRAQSSRPVFGMASRPDTENLLARLLDPESPQIVVCEGGAGLGKSAVVADILAELTGRGWIAVALSMDGVEAETKTAAVLGSQHVGPMLSPAQMLTSASDGRPAVLVVDQLDAVSTYSGRMPDAYEAVDEMLSELSAASNVKVLLAARTIDIDKDPRLSGLVAQRSRVERFLVHELSEVAVQDALAAAGITTGQLGAVTLGLLRTPLHFSVFSRLSQAARTTPYGSLQELYVRYTEEQRSSVEEQLGPGVWKGITGSLVAWMSQHETLTAPTGSVEDYAQSHVGALESAGVLVRSGLDRIGFFHETYFDFLFARAFVASGGDVHGFLAESGQHLFRRAQTRQLLEYLLADDRQRFHRVVVQLLTSQHVRSHLRDVVLTVLQQMDAREEDWEALESLAWDSTPVADRVRWFLSAPQWFDASDHNDRWEGWLRTEPRRSLIQPVLQSAARQRPQRAVELLHPYLGVSPEWDQYIASVVHWSLTPELADFAVEAIARGLLDEVQPTIAVNSDFWSLLYPLASTAPETTARLIGAYLKRHRHLAEADGTGDPFEAGHLPTNSQGAGFVLTTTANAVPRIFAEQVLDFVIAVATAGVGQRSGTYASGGRWSFRFVGSHSVDTALFQALDAALQSLAGAEPASARAFLEQLTALDTPALELRFLACRLHTALGDGDEAIAWLLADERNLRLGYLDTSRWASRELIASATVNCSAEALADLVSALLDYYSSWERHIKGRKEWGLAQYELLSAVDEARRDSTVTRRLGEWQRKFPRWSPQPPEEMRARSIGSPIPAANARLMTDQQWRLALASHSSPEAQRRWMMGGAGELAQVLGEQAQQEPERFTRLALTLDGSFPACYLDAVIRNAGPHLSPAQWTQLCVHAHSAAGEEVTRAICHVIETAPALCGPEVVAVLQRCAGDLDAHLAEPRSDAYSNMPDRVLTAGLNSNRGQTALAVAAFLLHSDQHLPTLATLTEQLANDPSVAVRSCAADAVRALITRDTPRALNAADQLFAATDEAIYSATTAQHLLIAALYKDPARFAPTLARALQTTDESATGAGRVWAVATLRGAQLGNVPTSVQELSPHARQGAAEVLSGNLADSHTMMPVLFNDTDSAVREKASQALRDIADLTPSQADDLIQAFISSPAFTDHYGRLLAGLHHHPGPLPSRAIDACEAVTTMLGSSMSNIRTRHGAAGHDLVPVVLRLYRQGTHHQRIRCLDVIDQLVEAGAYGLGALETER